MTLLWVALAGSAGAVARFVLDGWIRSTRSGSFPWGTFVINVSGSLLLGLVTGLVLFHGQSDTLRVLVGVGFCGGYTTFSTASFETVRLVQQGRSAAAVTNSVGTLAATVAAGALGLALGAR